MKHLLKSQILSNKKLTSGIYELILEAPEIAAAAGPGQFIQIKVDDSLNPLLPRPMGLSFASGNAIGVVYKTVGKGTQILAGKKKGDFVIIIGPLGNTFSPASGKTVALVAGGSGLGPVVFLAEKMTEQKKCTVICFFGAQTKQALCYLERLKKSSAHLYLSTDDGTAGHKGFITEILQKKCKEHSVSHIVSVGPPPMMKASVNIANKLKIPIEISLEERMACGFGICLGCACKMRDGHYHMICVDGPVFKGNKVNWEEYSH